jgi:hypothetical protein
LEQEALVSQQQAHLFMEMLAALLYLMLLFLQGLQVASWLLAEVAVVLPRLLPLRMAALEVVVLVGAEAIRVVRESLGKVTLVVLV